MTDVNIAFPHVAGSDKMCKINIMTMHVADLQVCAMY
jgi:hypothetical protein